MTDRLYARISLDTAASGSIAKQRAALERAAGAGAVFYSDESVSGSKVPFAKRPAGARLLAELRSGDRVLITKIDRAARNTRDLLDLVEHVKGAGATLRFVEQDINTEGPMGSFMLTLLAAVAELEADMIGERRRESLLAFKAEGRHAVGRAPFGLESVPNPAGRGLVLRPHAEEAPRLRDAVERLLAGAATVSELARDLGMKHDTQLSRLLRNERLAGILEQTPQGPRMDRDMAVFTLAEWDRLQRFLTARPVKKWTPSEGIGAALECAACGDRLYFNDGPHPTYRCRGKKHGKGAGRGAATVAAAAAEAYVRKLFLATMGELAVTETVTEESDAPRLEAVAVAGMRVRAAEEALRAAKSREEHLAATSAHWEALEALEAAQALPVETFSVVRSTGETFAELFERGGADRVHALELAGRWIVSPGRLPIAEKIRHLPDTLRVAIAEELPLELEEASA